MVTVILSFHYKIQYLLNIKTYAYISYMVPQGVPICNCFALDNIIIIEHTVSINRHVIPTVSAWTRKS